MNPNREIIRIPKPEACSLCGRNTRALALRFAFDPCREAWQKPLKWWVCGDGQGCDDTKSEEAKS